MDEGSTTLDQRAKCALSNAATLVSGSMVPEDVISGILRLLCDDLNLQNCRVLLPDPRTKKLSLRYSCNLAPDDEYNQHAITNHLANDVMLTNNMAITSSESVATVNTHSYTNTVENSECSNRNIAVPISRDNEALGVLVVVVNNFVPDELDNILSVLIVMAAFINQALLVKEMMNNAISAAINKSEVSQIPTVVGVYGSFKYGILGQSAPLRSAIKNAMRAASSRSAVMIIGESGTGKEKFARMIHDSSNRRDKPFIYVNCAAIPGKLLEAKLFGCEQDNLGNIVPSRKGKFEFANNGTLFLDEIGEMNMDVQTKLLQFLQSNTIQRVGAIDDIPVDVRIITATYTNLQESVNNGTFRLDLYYRLNVVRLQLPPLRKRKGDIPLLAKYFWEKENEHQEPKTKLLPRIIDCLEKYSWPGNIRQLKNVIERAILMSDDKQVTVYEIEAIIEEESQIHIQKQAGQPIYYNSDSYKQSKMTVFSATRPYNRVRSQERDTIIAVLKQSRGNKTYAAKQLGLTPRQLHYRLDKLNIVS